MIDELKIRRKKLYSLMNEKNIDACLIASKLNLYYLTGVIFDGYFFMDINGASIIFTRKTADFYDDNVNIIRKPEQIPELLQNMNIPLPATIMLEDDYLSASEWMRLTKVFENAECASNVLRTVRTIKTDYEIELLKESGKKHSELYSTIKGLYKKGMTDLDISYEIEYMARKLGSLGLFRIFGSSMEIFMGSILVGQNASNVSQYDFALGGSGISSSIPVGANGTPITEGTTIMVDVGGNFTGYMTDMTRVFAVGDIPQKAYDLHNIGIEILNEAALIGKEGAYCFELYEKAEQIISKYNVQEYYMESTNKTKFLGHGLGMEINELPVITKTNKQVLKNNMVIALEPKFVLNGVGAVGIENTYVVKDNGLEKITNMNEEIILI